MCWDQHGLFGTRLPLERGEPFLDKAWIQNKAKFEFFGIFQPQVLLTFSDAYFEKLLWALKLEPDKKADGTFRKWRKNCLERQQHHWLKMQEDCDADGRAWEDCEKLGKKLAYTLKEKWDLKAQFTNAWVCNDFKPPDSLRNFFPMESRLQRLAADLGRVYGGEERAKFEEIVQFFAQYEVTCGQMTHSSLLGCRDKFGNTGKWFFKDTEERQDELFRNVAWLYEHPVVQEKGDIPRPMCVYLSERQTPIFPFIEDFDVEAPNNEESCALLLRNEPWGSFENEKVRTRMLWQALDRLLVIPPLEQKDAESGSYGDPGPFLQERALVIHDLYPHIQNLQVFVYSASGENKKKKKLKSSFHLVWKGILVDADRAPAIRNATLLHFNKLSKQGLDHHVTKTGKTLLRLHETNTWDNVFDKTTIHARNGLRLPYSDKGNVVPIEEDLAKFKQGLISKKQCKQQPLIEHRPNLPLGVISFTFRHDAVTAEDVCDRALWTHVEKDYTAPEWMHHGTCRRNMDNPPALTYWDEERVKRICDMTSAPLPNVLQYFGKDVDKFVKAFDDVLDTLLECDEDEGAGAPQVELSDKHRRSLHGSWIRVQDEVCAIWRSSPLMQCRTGVRGALDFVRSDSRADCVCGSCSREGSSWGRRRRFEKTCRPLTVTYLRGTHKVILDGPDDLCRVLAEEISFSVHSPPIESLRNAFYICI